MRTINGWGDLTKRRLRLVFAVGLVALSTVFAVGASAQDAMSGFYEEAGIRPNRDDVNQHATEHIDPFNGALQLSYVGVHLPGNGGFVLKVVRSFNSARFTPSSSADPTLKRPWLEEWVGTSTLGVS
ncbi:MAG: hypothetical protein HEQ39_18055 [Rhizobacter sp.]